jgi:hypothetical protein
MKASRKKQQQQEVEVESEEETAKMDVEDSVNNDLEKLKVRKLLIY